MSKATIDMSLTITGQVPHVYSCLENKKKLTKTTFDGASIPVYGKI